MHGAGKPCKWCCCRGCIHTHLVNICARRDYVPSGPEWQPGNIAQPDPASLHGERVLGSLLQCAATTQSFHKLPSVSGHRPDMCRMVCPAAAGGCPVLEGTKLIATRWIRAAEFH